MEEQRPARSESVGEVESAEGGKIKNLGDRMKEHEKMVSSTGRIDPSTPYVIRLDGHKFSKFTKAFKRPYDERIHIAMIETAKELLTTFNPRVVYTCSDEITMVFTAVNPKEGEEIEGDDQDPRKLEQRKERPFNFLLHSGKIQKIVSLTAAFASSCFAYHLRSLSYDPVTEADLLNHVQNSRPHFDSRVHNVPNNAEAYNNVYWRASYDFKRNSIAGLAQHYFSHKELQGLNTTQMLEKLEKEKQIDWNDCPDWYKWGAYVKKGSYHHVGKDRNGQEVMVVRHCPVVVKKPTEKLDETNIKFLLCKCLTPEETPSTQQ
ncbi:Thg1 domain-containing protein [Balamuthia mandrillaris]